MQRHAGAGLAVEPPPRDGLAARIRARLAGLWRGLTGQAAPHGAAVERKAPEQPPRDEELAARVWEAMRIAAGMDQPAENTKAPEKPPQPQPRTPPPKPPRLPAAGTGGPGFDLFAGGLRVQFFDEHGAPRLPSSEVLRRAEEGEELNAPPVTRFAGPALAEDAAEPPSAEALHAMKEEWHFKPLDPEAFAQHIAVKGREQREEEPAAETPIGETGPQPPRPRETSPWVKAGARQRVQGQAPTHGAALGAARRAQLQALKARLQALGSSLLEAQHRRGAEPMRLLAGAGEFLLRLFTTAKVRAIAWWERVSGPPQGIIADAVPFQPDLEEIIEEPAPTTMRAIHYFVASLVVILLVITSLVDVEIVIQGSGQITTATPPITLQPMERAIVREVKVKAGDTVTKGQVLATLDPTFAKADMEALVIQQKVLQAQTRRIEAEVAGTPFAPLDASDANDILQAALYGRRQSQYAARVRAYDEEIDRWESMIKAAQDDRGFLAKQLTIASEVENMRTTLWHSRLTSKLQLLESQSTKLRFERDHQSVVDKLSELQHNAQAKRAERQAFIDEWRRMLLEDLMAKRTELGRINEALAKATRMRELVRLVAPEDGVVLEVGRRSAGSVVREVEPLVTLIPSSATLIAELVIGSGDIGYASPGDRVVIKIDAFPYQRHGLVEGRLVSISEESYSPMQRAKGGEEGTTPLPSTGGAVHRARVALIDTSLVNLPAGARLIPGMTLSGEIKVGRRSVISYFLYPITRGLGEAMREP